MKLHFALLLITYSMPLLARADSDPKLSPAYSKCIARADAVEPKVLECISEEFTVQDRRLNASYRVLIAKLTPERRKQLQEAQRAWNIPSRTATSITTRMAEPPLE